MRTAGLNLPTQYMDVLSAGPSLEPMYLHGAVGTAFLTPEQGAFKATRKKYGTLDDPDAGGYHLNQIDWDKDNGDTEVTAMEATYGGWYSAGPSVKCECPGTGPCGCK